ncbi:MAG: helix-turn-helix transcriptional regulator, partial [Lachnospiraceae bacterium]|nr:helix-turn-helix transcriptional regulator [Lachnospiraceae bacterium]
MDYVLLGQKIRAARIAAGLSQEKLAEMVGLTSQH